MKKSDGLQAIEQPLTSLPRGLRQLILERIQTLTHYEPVIGIMGKTGAGKAAYAMPYLLAVSYTHLV